MFHKAEGEYRGPRASRCWTGLLVGRPCVSRWVTHCCAGGACTDRKAAADSENCNSFGWLAQRSRAQEFWAEGPSGRAGGIFRLATAPGCGPARTKAHDCPDDLCFALPAGLSTPSIINSLAVFRTRSVISRRTVQPVFEDCLSTSLIVGDTVIEGSPLPWVDGGFACTGKNTRRRGTSELGVASVLDIAKGGARRSAKEVPTRPWRQRK